MTSPVSDTSIESVRQFNRFFTSRIGVLNETLVDSPFTLGEARVLYELAHAESAARSITTSTLSRTLDLDPAYLSRIMAGFVKRGFVSRQRSKSDGRQWMLTLTSKGARAFAPVEHRSRDSVRAMLAPLAPDMQRQTIDAMRRIERILSNERSTAPIVLRSHQAGDMGWITHRQAMLYHQEYGWNEEYEALIAEIMAKFLREFDPRWERCWVAEQEGEIVGSVFVVRKAPKIAQLRLLYVEPRARGAGLGRQLVEECIRFATAKKYATLVLWTNNILVSARRIYETAGFRLVSEEKNRMFGRKQVGQHWEREL